MGVNRHSWVGIGGAGPQVGLLVHSGTQRWELVQISTHGSELAVLDHRWGCWCLKAGVQRCPWVEGLPRPTLGKQVAESPLHMRAPACTCMRMHTHAHAHATHTCTHTHTHTRTHARTHTTHAHTHTHTPTHACSMVLGALEEVELQPRAGKGPRLVSRVVSAFESKVRC